MKPTDLNKDIYRNRFEGVDIFRVEFYKVFEKEFFKKYVSPESRVLEIGAGHCELINAIQAKQKVALDINPDVSRHAAEDVTAIFGTIDEISDMEKQFDVIIINNVLEHLTHSQIVDILERSKKLLKNGKIILLLPNIRYCYKNFWMFFDHITPLDDRAIVELLISLGYEITEARSKFLPYTSISPVSHGISRLPLGMTIVKVYLHVPLLWKIFGKQMFIVARVNE